VLVPACIVLLHRARSRWRSQSPEQAEPAAAERQITNRVA
jgi:hypothetical protein